jgi:hypothetical protein
LAYSATAVEESVLKIQETVRLGKIRNTEGAAAFRLLKIRRREPQSPLGPDTANDPTFS